MKLFYLIPGSMVAAILYAVYVAVDKLKNSLVILG
jgi:hypothetical protein